MPKKKPPAFIDLFAGIGGFRQAFEEVGAKCVFASEWDKYAQQTYEANFGHLPMGDITKIKATDIPAHEILTGGFPCQPFSQAGQRKGFADRRGTLFFEIERIVRHHQPSILLLENVKGFLRHDEGRTLNTVMNVLSEIGYNVYVDTLNSKDFGLPQNRDRVFVIAIHDEKVGDVEFEFPEPTLTRTRVGSILEPRVSSKYTISDRLWDSHQRRKADHIRRGNGFGYSLFDANSSYTSTLSARYYKDGSEALIAQKNGNPRKLTPREAARLQGFPDSFVIPVSDTQAYRQFGNSVSVPVIKELAKKVIELL